MTWEKCFFFFFSKILSYTFRLSKKSKHAEYPKDIQSKVRLEGHTAEKLIIRRCRERISEGHSVKSWFKGHTAEKLIIRRCRERLRKPMVVYKVNMTFSFYKRNQFIRKISAGLMKWIISGQKECFWCLCFEGPDLFGETRLFWRRLP